jgi:uncharacterized damage-inducible protein DinB
MSASPPGRPSSSGATGPPVLPLLAEVDELRTHLLERVRALPPEGRERRAPGGQGWTAEQVLQHLYLSEGLVLKTLDASSPRGAQARPSLKHRMGRLLVALVFRLGIRVRAPTTRVLPEPALPLSEVEAAWAPVSRALRERLEEAHRTSPRAAVMRHPVSGPMDASGAARFLLDHMRHHQRQLDRILGR